MWHEITSFIPVLDVPDGILERDLGRGFVFQLKFTDSDGDRNMLQQKHNKERAHV